jgi:hypothetical protein
MRFARDDGPALVISHSPHKPEIRGTMGFWFRTKPSHLGDQGGDNCVVMTSESDGVGSETFLRTEFAEIGPDFTQRTASAGLTINHASR